MHESVAHVALISIPLLMRVENEEEAITRAMALRDEALRGAQESLEEALAQDYADKAMDHEEIRDFVWRSVAVLAPSVQMLPQDVLEGPN